MQHSPYHIEFQFHNGSIKRKVKPSTRSHLPMFQFHNGSIKSSAADSPHNWALLFQFHNGSIKSSISRCGRTQTSWVSIPQWFD